jgi:hypothetical protein
MRRLLLALLAAAGLLVLSTTAAGAQANDQNCADFGSQADAQAHLSADTSDPDRLDADNDGKACEDFAFPEAGGDRQTALPLTGARTVPLASVGAGLLMVGCLLVVGGRVRYQPRHLRG